MVLRLRCQCGVRLTIPDDAAFKAGKCPRCQTQYRRRDGDWYCVSTGAPETKPDLAKQQRSPSGKTPAPDTACQSSDVRNAQIRKVIARLAEHAYPGFAEAVNAVALAAHPWPDKAVSDRVLDVIAAELLPGRNLAHHSTLEIATDRLLRIADALQNEGLEALSRYFHDASNHVQELAHSPVALPEGNHAYSGDRADTLNELIADPLSIGRHRTFEERDLNQQNIEPSSSLAGTAGRSSLEALAALLLGAAVAAESTDIGVILGGDVCGVSVSQLTDQLGVSHPLKAIDDYLDQLDSRDRDLLVSRMYTLGNSETLADFGARWGISRERVRQREKKIGAAIEERFAGTLSRMGQPILNLYMKTIEKTESLHAAVLTITVGSKQPKAIAAMILGFLGPWIDRDGWAVHESIAERIGHTADTLSAAADEYGLLVDGTVEQALEGFFQSDVARDTFAGDVMGLSRVCDFWSIKDTLTSRVIAALRSIGHPATKQEIAERIGSAPEQVGSILGNQKDIVRADKYRWGFEEWIDDAYDGIVGEIAQRIDEFGGAVPVDLLLNELPNRFHVSEGSIRAYLASDAFVVEDLLVRHADDDQFSPRPPHECSGAVCVNGAWGQRLRLYDRHFAGYSLGVTFDIAYANGIIPGDDLIVPVEGGEFEVSVIWRRHSLNRLVDVGRVTNVLTARGFQPDDIIAVFPTREEVRFVSGDEIPEITEADHERDQHVDLDIRDESHIVNDPLLGLLKDA